MHHRIGHPNFFGSNKRKPNQHRPNPLPAANQVRGFSRVREFMLACAGLVEITLDASRRKIRTYRGYASRQYRATRKWTFRNPVLSCQHGSKPFWPNSDASRGWGKKDLPSTGSICNYVSPRK